MLEAIFASTRGCELQVDYTVAVTTFSYDFTPAIPDKPQRLCTLSNFRCAILVKGMLHRAAAVRMSTRAAAKLISVTPIVICCRPQRSDPPSLRTGTTVFSLQHSGLQQQHKFWFGVSPQINQLGGCDQPEGSRKSVFSNAISPNYGTKKPSAPRSLSLVYNPHHFGSDEYYPAPGCIGS